MPKAIVFFILLLHCLLLYGNPVGGDTIRITEIKDHSIFQATAAPMVYEYLPHEIKDRAPKGLYWYSFVVTNEGSAAKTLFIINDRYELTLNYTYSASGELIHSNTTGLGYTYDQYFDDLPYISTIPVPRNAVSRVYMGYQSGGSQKIQLSTEEGIYKYIYSLRYRSGLQMLINTLGIGFLSFIFLFFLFYSIVAKQKLYTLYTLYLFMALFFCLSMYNELAGYAQVWINRFLFIRYFNEVAVAFMFVFYIYFGDQLLEISKQRKLLKRIFNISIIALALYGTFHFICQVAQLSGPFIETSYSYFRIVFLPVYVIILFLIIVQIKSPLKPFFLIANFFLLSGVIASVWIDFTVDILRVGIHEIYPGAILQMGIVGETICFSLALGYYSQLIRRQRDEKIRSQEEIEKRIQQISVQSLEAQMNPHFLFNGINAVRDLVMKNQNHEALNYMNSFALLLRNSLVNSRKEFISLFDELESIKHYLTIEKLRSGSDIDFDITVENDINLHDIDVPPRLLQPIVENAIKHGLRPSKKTIKNVTIAVKENNDELHLIISDNGIGLSNSLKIKTEDPLKNANLGLKLTFDRLAVYNEKQDKNITLVMNELVTDEGEIWGTEARFIITNKLYVEFKHGKD